MPNPRERNLKWPNEEIWSWNAARGHNEKGVTSELRSVVSAWFIQFLQFHMKRNSIKLQNTQRETDRGTGALDK